MVSDRSASRFLALPSTGWGHWSFRLLVVFLTLFPTWLAYSMFRRIPRPTFFSDPLHAILLLTAAGAAVLGAILGAWAVMGRGERSILTFLSILIGGFVGWWGGAEILFPH